MAIFMGRLVCLFEHQALRPLTQGPELPNLVVCLVTRFLSSPHGVDGWGLNDFAGLSSFWGNPFLDFRQPMG